jgi:hypothetical protein
VSPPEATEGLLQAEETFGRPWERNNTRTCQDVQKAGDTSPPGTLTGELRVTSMMVMAKQQPFTLIYDPEVAGHLAAIERKYHSLIRRTIEQRLRFEPEKTTRNRKQLERFIDRGARWELRLGPDNRFRVFYHVEAEQRQVRILAIGVKVRDRLFLAGEEVEL